MQSDFPVLRPLQLKHVVETLTYGMVTLAFYHLDSGDSYQAYFLMGEILVATVMGLSSATNVQ